VSTEQIIAGYLLYALIPLWLLTGLLDWMCHRASRIETTSGVPESAIHLALFAEAGIALLCGLYLEITASILLIMIGAWVMHEVTGYWDFRLATDLRTITPFEQRVHDYMAAIPFAALSLVVILHWQQAAALVGLGPESADFSIRLKDTPLSLAYRIGLPLAVILLNAIPYAEEFTRCWRARMRLKTA
jgi:hypothetical protein